uniref:Uncharacterized protein n=1 Tax=Candidatus Nitrotoga fabula TaxID=2182327 RepID=A0A2X0SI18_9PROT|nr:conserved protein of unknown function [Candidatus Nitrotoga fabula]
MTTKAKSTIKSQSPAKTKATASNTKRVAVPAKNTTATSKSAAKTKTAANLESVNQKTPAKTRPATKATAVATAPKKAAGTKTPSAAAPVKAAAPKKAATRTETRIPAAKSATTVTKAASTSKLQKEQKDDTPKKIKMVRDSFSMPENDYSQFAILKRKCLLAGIPVKKSELLRAGLICLSKLSDSRLLSVVGQVEVLKTGRPAKNPKE